MELDEIKKYFNSLQIDDWEASGNINKGGQATTIEVRRISDGKLGVFRFLKRTNPVDIKRFKREVEILTKSEYKHDNILNILKHTSLESEEYWYISEKGESFTTYWKKQLSTSEEDKGVVDRSIKVLLDLLKGLERLHEEKIVHRDIKPDNIVVVNDKVVLIDFGLVFDPNDERFTPLDSAVGNAKYSPDQMMNRLDDVPAWLDVFQIIQLLIWLVSKQPTKNWSRPLDWRWVILRDDISEEEALSLRALMAVCSDINSSPKNAKELIQLIHNIFEMKDSTSNDADLDRIKKIKEQIKSGRAQSLISVSEDLAAFNASFPVYLNLYTKIESHLESIVEKYHSDEIQLEIEKRKDIHSWAEAMRQTKKFISITRQLLWFHCGNRSEKHFSITMSSYFWPPSMIPSKPEIDYLPEGFLPFSMAIQLRYDRNTINTKGKRLNLFIAIDREGNLWKSENSGNFKTNRVKTNIDEINTILEETILDPEMWGLINQ